MTPDRCRGSFHCAVIGLRKVPRLRPGLDPAKKKGPEKSDPTQLSYHILLFKSMGNQRRKRKICALHKNRCAHLGNIPS